MQDSMMIAEVGDMLNVSGSRMATPLAPPSPGNTPMSTPRVIPMSMYMTFAGSPRTLKPPINELSASTRFSFVRRFARSPGSVAEQVLERSFRQRHEEPELKNQEQGKGHRYADDSDRKPLRSEERRVGKECRGVWEAEM